MTRILVHSNGPHVKTGYGVQTRHLVERLHDLGHDVAVSCTYGVQGEIMPWSARKIRLYPTGYEVNGLDVVHSHALHHFDGDPLGGWIIPLLDVWCLTPNPVLKNFNVAAWTPVDHFPVPPDVRKFFEINPDAVPIAMSRFGEQLLREAGLDPVYIPLSVDTTVYKPTESITINGETVTGRELLAMGDGPRSPIPDDAFLVGMVGMNKGWAKDRKGFNEAFRAFARFWKDHPNAILYVHADWPGGAEGQNLKELAIHAAIPDHAIRWPDQYAYRMGFSPEMMAAVYTAFDVLLAPSHGEGFCVPLIEAQACGTPVIVTDFSSQPELCGAGWRVGGQPEWDQAQRASYVCPYVGEIIAALEAATTVDMVELGKAAVAFAARYDTDEVFLEYWMPFLASLEEGPDVPELERPPMPDTGAVAVIVPAMRPENLPRLIESFKATNDGSAELVLVFDNPFLWPDEYDPERTRRIASVGDWHVTDKEHTTYAEKVNLGLSATTQPWVLLVGDDVEFKPGWIQAARQLSDRFDVIGTNDSSNGVKNVDVAAGRHSDHSFIRRAYVDEYGACLEGPGHLAPTVYEHWYVDVEMVELAKARGVFTPCLDSVVEHHHPGYDGREDLREADPVYMAAVEHAEADARQWRARAPLVAMQRMGRARR